MAAIDPGGRAMHAPQIGEEFRIAPEPFSGPADTVKVEQRFVVLCIAPIGARIYAGCGFLTCHVCAPPRPFGDPQAEE
jgi:hypothetical protein